MYNQPPLPMHDSTPSISLPKEATLKRLSAFARAYRPQLQTPAEVSTTTEYTGKVVMLSPL